MLSQKEAPPPLHNLIRDVTVAEILCQSDIDSLVDVYKTNTADAPYTKFIACLLCSIRASSYDPGNRAGSVSGTIFVFCSYGTFQLVYRDEQGATLQVSSR